MNLKITPPNPAVKSGFELDPNRPGPVTIANGQAWIGKPLTAEGIVIGFQDYNGVLASAKSMQGYQLALPGWSMADGLVLLTANRQGAFGLCRPQVSQEFRGDFYKALGVGSSGLPLPNTVYGGVQYAMIAASQKPLNFLFFLPKPLF